MRTRITVGTLLIVLGYPLLCLGHGVEHEIFAAGTGIKARYSDETPMAYCDVAVFAPDDTDSEYQTGTTDRNGCFAFVPDTSGVWRVTVDDGMGHRLTAEIPVDSLQVARTNARHGRDRVSYAIIGISVIFGLFGLFALLRSSRRAPDGPGRGDG
jgi:nickel transport protein